MTYFRQYIKSMIQTYINVDWYKLCNDTLENIIGDLRSFFKIFRPFMCVCVSLMSKEEKNMENTDGHLSSSLLSANVVNDSLFVCISYVVKVSICSMNSLVLNGNTKKNSWIHLRHTYVTRPQWVNTLAVLRANARTTRSKGAVTYSKPCVNRGMCIGYRMLSPEREIEAPTVRRGILTTASRCRSGGSIIPRRKRYFQAGYWIKTSGV